MNMFKKSELSYQNGFIVKDDKIVAVDNEVVDLFNKIERDVQYAKWSSKNKIEQAPEVEPFMRETERGAVYPFVLPTTPCLDSAAEKAIEIMDELDEIEAAEKINKYFYGIKPVLEFVADEFVIDSEHATPHRFDLPTLGNPLDLSKDDLASFVIDMFTDKAVVVENEQE